jgi:hemerythrin-like domain-containing protein
MKATEILMAEHTVINRVLDTLELAADAAEKGIPVRPGFFIDSADFIRGFADGCHHRKEEGVLFKMMVANGISEQGGPVGMMLSEHEQGRVYTRGMRTAAQAWEAGDDGAREQVVENALGYVGLLRQHIQKENNVLFPMADRVIPQADHDAVFDGFEQVEHEETGEGVHEKYLGMALRLEQEASQLPLK